MSKSSEDTSDVGTITFSGTIQVNPIFCKNDVKMITSDSNGGSFTVRPTESLSSLISFVSPTGSAEVVITGQVSEADSTDEGSSEG